MGLVARGFGVHAERLQPAALLPQFGAEEIPAFFDLRLAPGDDVEFFRPGRHLVEPGPAHGVEPLAADGLVAVVHRPRRGVLALEGVPGVEPPQPPVARDPRWQRVHEARGVPLPVLPGSDRHPVPAPVIHEGDGECS